MKKISVFYHLAALNHLWKDFVDEQLGLVKQSGLSNVASVYVCYVSPEEILNEVKDYLKKEYSFVTILSARTTEEENLYEGQTLTEIQQYSKFNNGYVLYIHSKGVAHSINSHQTIPTRDWRHYLNYWMIERWEDCIKKLESVSVVGTNYNQEPYPHFSGNFWWSTTEHIQSLPDVLNRSLYYDESLTEKLGAHTFSYEMWILHNHPQVDSIHFSYTNHYLEPYSREKYVKNTISNQKKIAVFYHLFIADTSETWVWWIEEQMGLLKSTGLADNADVFLCSTLPTGLINQKNNKSFDEMVVNYINDNFPFVKILDIRGLNEEPNLFEGQTTHKLWDYCKTFDGYVFYFHSKGINSYGTHIPGGVHDWKALLHYFNLEKWRDCVAKLDEGYDACGINFLKEENLNQDTFTEEQRFLCNHFAGNFWWSTAQNIRNLPDPLNIDVYCDTTYMMEHLKTYRYAFEIWIARGCKPDYSNYYTFHQSNTHHYFEFYPKEKYIGLPSIEEQAQDPIHIINLVGAKNHFNWKNHITFAQWIVKHKNPEVIVDLGVDYAYSTFCFALPKIGKIYGIDSFEGDKHAGMRNTYDFVNERKKN